ncbi:DUF4435 domain-containing protein [Duganella hordei]|uniref:DUF4435 domain-containing protein n=1 Tax=Duganella hordei TaxID=2865934 RepID=UPI0030E92DDD
MDKYEPDEILNLAIMSKIPYFIVEGVDDINVYEEIAKSVQVECEIYSVEMLDGLAGGNDGVVQAMQILDALPMTAGQTVQNYVMGILDRDARFYRNEMPNLASIFCLKLYSLESHFVSKSTIKPTIDLLTRNSVDDEIDIDEIFAAVEYGMSDIYYFSLDALRKSVDPTYQSIVSYSSGVGRRKDANTMNVIFNRKDDLDIFAAQLNLNSKVYSMREFVKGKWLLTAFSEELYKEIEKLTIKCKSSTIKQCRMCELDVDSPCLFQVHDGYNKNILYPILQRFFEIPDLQYIKDKIISIRDSAMA